MNFEQIKSGGSGLSLEKIRNELVRLEDSIIFALIERVQFGRNDVIYRQKAFPFIDFEGSFLEYFIRQVECAHAKVRRYTSPDEYPFSRDLPSPVLPPITFPKLLIPNTINLNENLLKIIVPIIAPPGDDGNYGSAATKDCEALQLLSRRIHFGKFVAEAKFNSNDREKYIDLIRKGDRDGIEALLTNRAVEEKLLRRLRKKAQVYGREIEDGEDTPPTSPSIKASSRLKDPRIPVDAVVNIYKEFVIPLTKLVEVEYLMVRLNYPDFIPDS